MEQTGLGIWGWVVLAGTGSRMSSHTRPMSLDLETFLTTLFGITGPVILIWP